MYCRVIACDYDGTGATNGHLAPEVTAALHAAREAGIVTLLATGRVLDDLRVALVDFAAFDAVVAENGAVLWFPSSDRTVLLGNPPTEQILGRLRTANIPFHAGAVVVGAWDSHVLELLRLIRETGADLHLVFNRGAVMLLPSGVNKATGVERALAELRRSARNMVAFGDAENDLPLFALAEVGIAARGAVAAVAAAADDRLCQPGAAGVADWVRCLLQRGGQVSLPHRRTIQLGVADDGTPVTLPAGGTNVLVSGDPRSGKSWLAGLAAERLMEAGYRLCIIDPEGDHVMLGHRAGAVVLGDRIGLPSPDEVGTVIREAGMSVALNLSPLPHADKADYVCRALRSIGAERLRSGLPHWTMVDEAHYFFRTGAAANAEITSKTGNLMLVTYRPSLVAPDVLDHIGAFLLTRTTVDEQRYFTDGLLRARGPADLDVALALDRLAMPRAGLLACQDDPPRWCSFLPNPRLSTHTHHARKYADGELPTEKAFWFRLPNDGVAAVAHDVREFDQALGAVPLASLHHHLVGGDFSRWARDVLGDADLAGGLAKLEHTSLEGNTPDREELRDHVRTRYVV